MKVADVMTPRVFSVVADAPVSAAVEYMADSHVSALAVTDDHGRLLGLVSTSDVLRAASEAGDRAAREQLFEATRVAEIMTARPLRIGPMPTCARPRGRCSTPTCTGSSSRRTAGWWA
jgi:Predicted transcriptional regulator, contains C-terminal CBS domains